MMYRKLKPEETTIQAGDVVAAKYSLSVMSEFLQGHPGGTTFVLRPIPDEPEDVVRVEGEIQRVSWGDENIVVVHCAPRSIPSSVAIGQRVTLLIPRPDPPMPKCPYCGMELLIKHNDAGYWAEWSYSNCSIVVRGNVCRTRRAAIEAMTPKGGGQ